MLAPATTSASKRLSRFWDGLLFASLGFALLVWQSKNPVHSRWSNSWQLLGGALLILGVVIMVWRWRATRFAALGLVLAGAALFTLPGRAVNQAGLRARYVAVLNTFEKVPYVENGESTRGIDGSGLARRAWREALWQEGLATFNGTLLRAALGQWLTDDSARDLAQGSHGTVIPLGISDITLEKFNLAQLQPGDLAITADGVHLLIYLGDSKWIEADPGLGQVLVLEVCCDESPWFTRPVRLYRWALLN